MLRHTYLNDLLFRLRETQSYFQIILNGNNPLKFVHEESSSVSEQQGLGVFCWLFISKSPGIFGLLYLL